MNKLYFGIPILCLVLFFGYAWHFKNQYEAEKDRIAQEKKDADEAKRIADQLLQVQVIEENNRITAAANAKRRADKEREEALRAAREQAVRDRDDANSRLSDIRRRHEALQKDLAVEEGLLKSAKDDLASLEAEKAFLASYVDLARNNASRMLALVTKVDTAAEAVRKKLDEIAGKKPAR